MLMIEIPKDLSRVRIAERFSKQRRLSVKREKKVMTTSQESRKKNRMDPLKRPIKTSEKAKVFPNLKGKHLPRPRVNRQNATVEQISSESE